LVGAPFILGHHVICIAIYLVLFECHDMPRWFPRQQVQFDIQTLITLTSFSQPTGERVHVLTRIPGISPPWELGSYNVLVFLDIWLHHGGVLQNYVVCFTKIIILLANIFFFPSVPFPLSLPSCCDLGTPIGSRSGIKSTQNSMTSYVS
jgi:hypothetical protein